MERTYDEEIHKRVNYLLREWADIQMQCSEDAFRIDLVCSEDIGFLYKQLENQSGLGELL